MFRNGDFGVWNDFLFRASELKVNNGWMSDLEAENIPTIGSMLQDMATPLDAAQQKSVAVWSVKTAMVSDSMKGRAAPNQFYSRNERVKLRVSREIPPRTLIWTARMDGIHLGNFGTDFALFNPQKERIGMGSVTTIVAGHSLRRLFLCMSRRRTPRYPNWDAKWVTGTNRLFKFGQYRSRPSSGHRRSPSRMAARKASHI
jgi:hypothetical protein